MKWYVKLVMMDVVLNMCVCVCVHVYGGEGDGGVEGDIQFTIKQLTMFYINLCVLIIIIYQRKFILSSSVM